MEFSSARSLTDFLRHHREHIARLAETGEPEALTVAGRPEVVVQAVENYGALAERLRYVEGALGLWQAHAQVVAGRTHDWETGLSRLRTKHGLSP